MDNNGFNQNQENPNLSKGNETSQNMYGQQTMGDMHNQNSYGQTNFNNFNGQPNNYGQMGGPQMNTNMNMQNVQAPGYMMWLILGIVQICTLCCCNCFTFVFGILTVVFACMANTQFKSGNMLEFQAKLKLAKIMNIIGWACIVLSIVINIVGGVFSSVMDAINY